MKRIVLLASVAALLSPSSEARGGGFSDLVVFGDSLSDNGNYYAQTGYPPPPYWEGRLSNGPVWVEQLASHLGFEPASISDFAVAGATTTDVLLLQVARYLASVGTADPSALYVYWAGGNDILNFIAEPQTTPQRMIATAMENTVSALVGLISAGARNVLVVNMPDVSLTPLVAQLGDEELSAAVRALCQAYNGALAQVVAMIEGATSIDIVEFDMFALTQTTVSDPLESGFSVVDEPALATDGSVAEDPDRYLFWDDVHPTHRGHSFIMGVALARLGILWGDADGSGVLDEADFALLAQSYGRCPPGSAADLDGNGRVNREDLELLHILLR